MGISMVLVVAGVAGVGLFVHQSCSRGRFVAGETFWTPFELVNVPYEGSTVFSSRVTVYDSLGQTVVSVNNATLAGPNLSSGYFETEYWSIFREVNVTSLGTGVDSLCSASLIALPSAPAYNVGADPWLQGPGNTSNVNEPTTFDDDDAGTAYPIPPAGFANGFVAPNLSNVSTCGGPAAEQNFSSTSFQTAITLATSSGPISVVVAIHSWETFTYHFPANGGIWLEDSLPANAGLKGPGLAFEWTPCP